MINEQQPPIKTGLLNFFKNSVGSQFVIPVYQRNYTWTANKEVKQYIDDLRNVLEGKFDKHFLGILIYLDTPINFATREFSVIDGQQRLTTTFLILYVIKNLMIEHNDNNSANVLESQFLTNQHVSDKHKFKLKPLVSDDKVYQQIVNGQFDDITEKNSNVFKNYNWLKMELEKLLEKYTFNEILLSLDKLYVVCVPVIKNDSPQKIFESINSTGAKLLSPDLIRNFILMDIESDKQEKYYNTYWKKIEDYITGDSKKLELFFRMFLACKNKNLSNLTQVYQDFKFWYSNEVLTREVEDILKEIVKYAKYFYIVYSKPIKDIETELKNSINEFRNNLSDMPAPFLIELYSLYESENEDGQRFVSAEQFNEIINIVNSYLIRRAICGLDTSDITRLFPTLLKEVMEDCNVDYSHIVEYVKKNLINKQRGKSAYMPDDETLRSKLSDANVYNLRVPLRVIFDKIETHNNPAPVNLEKLSVEHLIPQTPTKEWLDALNVDEITYDKYLHRLGNLTLATKVDNSKMKNKLWEYKKEILENTSHLTMNKEILSIERWTIEEINKRTDKLIEQIIQLYPYSTAADTVIVKHEISLDKDGVLANAILFEEDGSVEVQTGSEIVKYVSSTDVEDWQYDIYNELLEEGIIKETDKGAVFLKPYLFTSQKKNSTALSMSAGLILCGSRNGWEYWQDGSGNPLNSNEKLKERLTNKK
jgi:uncharacterized protein with ParB-like and HNH nuclease domain